MKNEDSNIRTIKMSPEELIVTCVNEDVRACRIAAVGFLPKGEVKLSTIHKNVGQLSRTESYHLPCIQSADFQSVVCAGRLTFFEASPHVWEFPYLPSVIDTLTRLKPPLSRTDSRDLFLAMPTLSEPVDQFVIDPGQNNRIARLTSPGTPSVMSIRVVRDLDILIGIRRDARQLGTEIVTHPLSTATIEQIKNPDSWQCIAIPSFVIERLSRPHVTTASPGFPRMNFIVSVGDGMERGLALIQESPKRYHQRWGEPTATNATTIGLLSGSTDRIASYASTADALTVTIGPPSETNRLHRDYLSN
ncbi:MAG: hypothetical protein ABIO72_03080 [Patescibacteria group bacterium]